MPSTTGGGAWLYRLSLGGGGGKRRMSWESSEVGSSDERRKVIRTKEENFHAHILCVDR